MAGDDGGQHEPADHAVRAEFGEAIPRLVDIDARRLPGQLQRREGEPSPEENPEPGGMPRCRPQQQCRAIEGEKPRPGP